MTAKEVIEIIKESNLWGTLTSKEQQEAVSHALKITQLSIKEDDIKNNVGEVYLEL